MKTKMDLSARLITILFFLASIDTNLAQETNDGDLGEISSGRISLSLQISNRPNPTLTLINRGGGTSKIPAFLGDSLTRALSNNRNLEFPVCVAGTEGREVTISVEPAKAGELMLAGTNGEQIPYEVNIKGNQDMQNGAKAQFKQVANNICDENSALKVNVTILENIEPEDLTILRGKFKLIVTSE